VYWDLQGCCPTYLEISTLYTPVQWHSLHLATHRKAFKEAPNSPLTGMPSMKEKASVPAPPLAPHSPQTADPSRPPAPCSVVEAAQATTGRLPRPAVAAVPLPLLSPSSALHDHNTSNCKVNTGWGKGYSAHSHSAVTQPSFHPRCLGHFVVMRFLALKQ